MKVRVSDYIADFLVSKGIDQVFCVCGGGSMHLNDSFGHHSKINCVYNHHEQASAMAAEGYARVHNKMAITCVTSGPGAINALNGVVGAYQDSIPMIVLSGQTKTTLTMKYNGLQLRTLGNQEVDIVSALRNMVKYAEMIMDPMKIRYCLEKAYITAISGRPGPCWLDIPLDIQGKYIETDNLEGYNAESQTKQDYSAIAKQILEKFKNAKRPVFYAGNGIRLSNGVELFHHLIETLKIPVVTCWNSIDLMATDDKYYCGRGGVMGDRAGNLAVQNSDFLLCIGTRLNIYQVGFDVKTWARSAYSVVVDIDPEELKKTIMRADLPVCADASAIMAALLAEYQNVEKNDTTKWVQQCVTWKNNYPVVQKRQYEEKERTNVYAFIDKLSHLLPENNITVVANGSASVVGSQTYYLKDGDRFIMNCALSSMGYALPASIGACVANDRKSIVCVEGDGSIMMNLQELQTIVTNKLPIKIFLINNNGYQQVRLTQNNIFHNGLVGQGPDSGDLGFPDFQKLAVAFGIPYVKINNNDELEAGIKKALGEQSYVLCEVITSSTQIFEPKSATKRLPDGTLVSPPLEDLAPFLPREELEKNMYIPLLPEK